MASARLHLPAVGAAVVAAHAALVAALWQGGAPAPRHASTRAPVLQVRLVAAMRSPAGLAAAPEARTALRAARRAPARGAARAEIRSPVPAAAPPAGVAAAFGLPTIAFGAPTRARWMPAPAPASHAAATRMVDPAWQAKLQAEASQAAEQARLAAQAREDCPSPPDPAREPCAE